MVMKLLENINMAPIWFTAVMSAFILGTLGKIAFTLKEIRNELRGKKK